MIQCKLVTCYNDLEGKYGGAAIFPGILRKLQVTEFEPRCLSTLSPSLSTFYFLSLEKLEPKARSYLGQYIHQTELVTKGKIEALRLRHSPYISAQGWDKNWWTPKGGAQWDEK